MNRIDTAGAFRRISPESEGFSFSDAIMGSIRRGAHPTMTEGFASELLSNDAMARGRATSPTEIFLPASWFERTLSASSTFHGAAAINKKLVTFHDLLASVSASARLGVRFSTGASGAPSHAGAASGLEATWVAENEPTPESVPTITGVTVQPKCASVQLAVTQALLKAGGPSSAVEAYLAEVMLSAVARAVDAAVQAGTGVGAQPTGVTYTAGVNAVVGGQNGAAPTLEHLRQMRRMAGEGGADLQSSSWLFSPKVGGHLINAGIWTPDNGRGTLLGCNVTESHRMPDDLVKGSSVGVCSAITFGDFQHVLVESWGAPSVLVDPFSLSIGGKVRMVVNWYGDVIVLRPDAFATMHDALAA